MEKDAPVNHERVSGDTFLDLKGRSYHGGVLLATAGGASTVAVYDGTDASGELIDYFSVAASQHAIHFFERGKAIKRGLFVDIGANVSSFVFDWADGR